MSSILSQKLKVALIQLAGSKPDKSANLQRAAKFIEKALIDQPDTKIVVLPECFNSPYAVDKFREYSEIITPDSMSIKFLSNLASKFNIYLIGGSIPELDPSTDKIYNTSIVFDNRGKLIGTHRKAHLFDVDIPNGITFKESETLSSGDNATTLDTKFGKIGLGICYDMRFPELAMLSARKGAFAMIYPSAFNTVTGPMHWHLLARSRAVDNQIYTMLCSPARDNNSSYKAYGHSLVVNPRGDIIAEAGEGEEIIYAELDPNEIDTFRQGVPVTKQRRFDIYPDVNK
ncbi:hypothetical protein Kpol_499p4 [Vanderwaltozyma polyspora DSM 70294]|uniref:CN hydrolase domain-containing protein n=1 Tax=Vanderwaltozyma polyspora (strain ATCC 22028 / DSM 70294 / BCRC 21397 / CBS 2163 / NBRC 10782 / NRRL Y-8283 / UCD 57-17) TaxID=436907 RepID=A7TP07_VANPO|nr:uncharacterized protein Kpol_499p4 [Vanderwaltozyma polyspora DSM 70294]EDO15976.1 hypothetical protein Kpol_499p4 [Vanderwaltozyma polyspora DSM 70294]